MPGEDTMPTPTYRDEAQKCRVFASKLKGKPEAAFLLSMATAFEDLDAARQTAPRQRA
jgi:hypothetical protein